jgi:hypothetical protein
MTSTNGSDETVQKTGYKEIKITPETFVEMNKEFEREGTRVTIRVPTQEEIDEWKQWRQHD